MSKKATDIVGYLGPIGFLISYFVGARRESMFHLNQALVLVVCDLALSALSKVAGYIPLLGGIIQAVLSCALLGVFVVWIFGIAAAISGKETPMPVLGWVKLI